MTLKQYFWILVLLLVLIGIVFYAHYHNPPHFVPSTDTPD
jgi:hypothetical protein